jgi:hypothetical protein
MNPQDPHNKAYWLPVPIEYLTAAGAVTAQWGYFEMQFDGLIRILCRHPHRPLVIDQSECGN